jgi:hypothetical protein
MIVFDLDGTLADHTHRLHYIDERKIWCKECFKLMSMEPTIDIKCLCGQYPTKWRKKWPAFFAACSDDGPIVEMIKMLNVLRSDYTVSIWTGRPESYMRQTMQWLEYHGVGYDKLKMRPDGDNTPAHQLKERWLDECWPPIGQFMNPPVSMAFDDSTRCVEMWRRRGIICCQVANLDTDIVTYDRGAILDCTNGE